MRIVFLCGSVEHGRDGVGDYTRLMAGECSGLGHACAVIALEDRFVSEAMEAEVEGVRILRLPAAMPWAERVKTACAFRAGFCPDWMSLQFVNYAFAAHGIVRGLADRLRPVIASHPLHILFHEPWIGAHIGAPVREKIIGRIQRLFALGMVRTLHPKLIHTTTGTYAGLLAQAGVTAGLLPLFGNIPIADSGDTEWISNGLKLAGADISSKTRGEFWVFAFFGTLHPVWPPEPLFARLREAARIHRRKIVLVSIGETGAGTTLWQSLAARYADTFAFCKFGARTAAQVSQLLQFADFGIATSPWSVIGKSGSVAAMIEHGLPVIVNRDEVRFRCAAPEPASPLLVRMTPELAGQLPGLKRQPARSGLPGVARQFLRELDDRGLD